MKWAGLAFVVGVVVLVVALATGPRSSSPSSASS